MNCFHILHYIVLFNSAASPHELFSHNYIILYCLIALPHRTNCFHIITLYCLIALPHHNEVNPKRRESKFIQFSIENVELMRKCCPQH